MMKISSLFLAAFFITVELSIFRGNNALAETAKPPIKFGLSVALTGKLASTGLAEKGGMELAVEDVNANGGINGRKLELVVEDNQGDAKIAVSAMEKLTTIEKVDLLFTAGTHLIEATKSFAGRSGKVMLYQASTNNPVQSNSLIFKDYGDAAAAGAFIAGVAAKNNYKKIAMVSEVSDVCGLYDQAFKDNFKEVGSKIISEVTYNPGEADFRSLLTKIKASKPDVLVLCIWRDTQSFMKQLKDLGMISIPSLHFHSAFLPISDTEEMRKLFEENHAISTWFGLTIADANAKQEEFIARYKKHTGESRPLIPDIAMAYDDVMLIAKALAPCSTATAVDSKCLAAKLSELSHEGLAGRLYFGPERMSVRPVFGIGVTDGQWRVAR